MHSWKEIGFQILCIGVVVSIFLGFIALANYEGPITRAKVDWEMVSHERGEHGSLQRVILKDGTKIEVQRPLLEITREFFFELNYRGIAKDSAFHELGGIYVDRTPPGIEAATITNAEGDQFIVVNANSVKNFNKKRVLVFHELMHVYNGNGEHFCEFCTDIMAENINATYYGPKWEEQKDKLFNRISEGNTE